MLLNTVSSTITVTTSLVDMGLLGLFFDVKKFPGTTCVKNASNFASKCSPMEDNDGQPLSFFFFFSCLEQGSWEMIPAAAAAAAAAADHPMLSLSSFLKKSRVGQEAPCFSYFIQLLYIQKRQWIQNRAIQKKMKQSRISMSTTHSFAWLQCSPRAASS